MTEIWVLIIYCISLTLCNPNNNMQYYKTFESKRQCQEYGLEILHNDGFGMEGRMVVCVEGVRP